MEKNKNTQTLVIAILSFAILFMSVGFAAYASNLNINGTATVKANKWSVHYQSNSYSEAENSVAATTSNLTDTDFTFTVTLTKPGDFYEAQATIVNDGTFNAKLTSLTMSTLTAAEQKYLRYKVIYDGTEYTATNSSLNLPLPYTTGSNTKIVKVRVEYFQPESSADLPQANDVDVTLTAQLHYDQAA